MTDLHYGCVRAAAGPRAVAKVEGGLVDLASLDAELFGAGTLDAFLAAGPAVWTQVHAAALAAEPQPPAGDNLLAFTVADYVDFYASEHHAANAGRILRPNAEPLTPNWKHLPIGYHGRAGSVVVSGTPVRRPAGQLGPGRYGPSERLDFEAELGFVVGVPSPPGEPAPAHAFAEHVFGVCLLDDWSARDIQRFEMAPLGPFLGKSFATSVSGWITPLAVLADARRPTPPQEPPPLPYLADPDGWSLDLELTVSINGSVVSRPPYAAMYWTPGQLLAHLTSNGAHLRTGDLFASGTISGPGRDQLGCLLELTRDGAEPLELADGTSRAYLEDGDEVIVAATAPSATGTVTLGAVRGRIAP